MFQAVGTLVTIGALVKQIQVFLASPEGQDFLKGLTKLFHQLVELGDKDDEKKEDAGASQ
jgi:hypothetical protein